MAHQSDPEKNGMFTKGTPIGNLTLSDQQDSGKSSHRIQDNTFIFVTRNISRKS